MFALLGAVNFFAPLDIITTSLSNKIRMHPASGDVIVVGMDGNAHDEANAWPWSQDEIASTLEFLLDAGARAVVLSHEVPVTKGEPAKNLAALLSMHPDRLFLVETPDSPEFAKEERSQIAVSSVSSATPVHAFQYIRYWGGVEINAFAMPKGDRILPSAASVLSGTRGDVFELYPIDYGIDVTTIPFLSLQELRRFPLDALQLNGMVVVLGFEKDINADFVNLLGQGRYGPATLIAMETETLLKGKPVLATWFLAWLLGLICTYGILRSTSVRRQLVYPAIFIAASFALTLALANLNVFILGLTNAWIMVLVGGYIGITRTLRDEVRKENLINPVSGLPSVDALRRMELNDQTLVHAKIRRSSELHEILSDEQKQQLSQKIAQLVNPEAKVWHGDNGRYYWFSNEIGAETAEQHFQSLSLIFRNGFSIDSLNISLDVVFGLDDRKEAAMTDRVQGVSLSAKQAIINGVQWETYEVVDRSAATWSLTLLRELDDAIKAGHIHVALQPKLDLRTGLISGAEALARWQHPTRGAITPDEFIPQAERGGRLMELTDCVLQAALKACEDTIKRDPEFILSVNIAPSMLEHAGLPKLLVKTLSEVGVHPRNIMLEVTESSQFANDDVCARTMQQLRELGFELSIDDYGTANSTLEYLRKIPASELKIDRKFVNNMLKNEADYHLVASTIQLAHRLRMLVVAEGVEDAKTLESLRKLNCDVIQGYYISRPLATDAFNRFILQYPLQEKRINAL